MGVYKAGIESPAPKAGVEVDREGTCSEHVDPNFPHNKTWQCVNWKTEAEREFEAWAKDKISLGGFKPDFETFNAGWQAAWATRRDDKVK
jgi:hypothetical protein